MLHHEVVRAPDPLGLVELCPKKGPCMVPNHPWYVSVDVNILEAIAGGRPFQFFMVLPHMPWDYKQQGPYDDFGNFNFGATGAALGYSDAELLRGAGALKVLERRVRHQPDPPDVGSPFGDYPYESLKRRLPQARVGARGTLRSLTVLLPRYYNPDSRGIRKKIELRKWVITLREIRHLFSGYQRHRVKGWNSEDNVGDDFFRFDVDLIFTPVFAHLLHRWRVILERRFEQRSIYMKISNRVTWL